MQTSPQRRPFHYNPPQEPLEIFYADDSLLAVNKPGGLLSVPGRAESHADCLVHRLRKQYPSAQIVHRLDMDTSGVMVLGLNPAAHKHLSLQFEQRKTEKTYIACVWGNVEGEEGLIDLPLRCDWPNRPLQMVDHELGRPAQTRWKVIARETQATRLRLFPITGRSHQLRVHMRELGHPIIGDNFYAPDEAYKAADRLQLHAETLSLSHPESGERLTFSKASPF